MMRSMTPQQLVDYLDANKIPRGEFAARLGVTPALISYWLSEGWIVYERQCQIQVELKTSKLRASWDDVPQEKRPETRATA